VEESKSKPYRSHRLAIQLSLTLETKPFREKWSHLIESNSPGLFETLVSTSSEITVTLIISVTSAFRGEVPQLQENIRIDLSVTIETFIPETTPSRVDPKAEVHLPEHMEVEFQNSKGITPLISITIEAIPSSAPEIFYRPDGLPLLARLIAIEEMVEDPSSSTPLHFGVVIHLHPSTPKVGSFNHPSSQVPVKLLGNLLDSLNMFEQPSTSRTVSTNTAAAKLPAAIPTMFAGISSVPTGYQSLVGVHSGAVSMTWSVPIYSPRIPSGISYVET